MRLTKRFELARRVPVALALRANFGVLRGSKDVFTVETAFEAALVRDKESIDAVVAGRTHPQQHCRYRARPLVRRRQVSRRDAPDEHLPMRHVMSTSLW